MVRKNGQIEVSSSDEEGFVDEVQSPSTKTAARQLSNMKELSIRFSKKFKSLIIPNIASAFPNLVKLQLVSCPVGISGCAALNDQNLPCLRELDFSGDSYLSKKDLSLIARNLPRLQIFHLGHFEHSDYACSETVRKKQGELPLKGLFVVELLSDKRLHFPNLEVLFLEYACDLTDFILYELRQRNVRQADLLIKYDNTQPNVEH